jgi:hypothetical protein
MKKILFYASHTLYYKVLIPVIIELVKKGHQVSVLSNRPNFYKYTPKKYSHRPTSNNCINKHSIRYSASLINYLDEFKQIEKKIKYVFFNKIEKYDIIIGVIKDFEKVKNIKKNGVKKIYIVGYQHMPFLLSLNKKISDKNVNILNKKLFLEDNQFSRLHRSKELVLDKEVAGYIFVNFTYLDKIYQTLKNITQVKKKYVLIFHPGGYRDVITKYGENKKNSYKKQKEFIKILCKPVFDKGLIPVLKVHPLFAKYHSFKDLNIIKNDLVKEDKNYEKFIITEDIYWDYAIKSKFILTLGSSSLYELYAAGINNVVVINFFGEKRSSLFKMFDNIIINSIDEYITLIKSNKDFDEIFKNGKKAFEIYYKAYSSLNTGNSVKTIINNIL